MDGKTDDQALVREFQRPRGMPLMTTPRNNLDHTVARQQMIDVLDRPNNRRLRQQRGQTVEPMPNVIKDLFALDRCGMHGYRNNRWLLAAMEGTMPIHQVRARKRQRSVWKIKEIVGL